MFSCVEEAVAKKFTRGALRFTVQAWTSDQGRATAWRGQGDEQLFQFVVQIGWILELLIGQVKVVVGEDIGKVGTNHQGVAMSDEDGFDAGAVGRDGHGGSGMNGSDRVKNQDVELAGFEHLDSADSRDMRVLFLSLLLLGSLSAITKEVVQVFQPVSYHDTDSATEYGVKGELVQAAVVDRPMVLSGAFPEDLVKAVELPCRLESNNPTYDVKEANLVVLCGLKLEVTHEVGSMEIVVDCSEFKNPGDR